MSAFVVIGGIKRIAKVSEIVVPFMAVLFYVALGAIIIITNITAVPAALVSIIKSALRAALWQAGQWEQWSLRCKKGIARGIFQMNPVLEVRRSQQRRQRQKEPVRQGLVSMTGTFIDTIVICTMTGLSIMIAGTWMNPELEGVELRWRHSKKRPAVPSDRSFVLTDALPLYFCVHYNT